MLKFQRFIGPSASHSLGAVGVVYLMGFVFGLIFGNGVSAGYYGAALMTGWFLGREIEQVLPHLGWHEWDDYDLTEKQRDRLIRQGLWPTALGHLAATSMWLIYRVF